MSRKPKKRRQPTPSRQWLSGRKAIVTGEVEYIIRRAQEHDERVVTLGSLVFFSTTTGDAWILDPEDSYALCLARDGMRQPARIIETEERFAIEWDRTYQIEGDLFVSANTSHRITAVAGYPTRQIVEAIERLGQGGPMPSCASAVSEPSSEPEDEGSLPERPDDVAAQLQEMQRQFRAALAGSSSEGNLGRNHPCWCGSGKKYKHCHLREDTK